MTNNIFLVGIKGVGMSSLAVYLKERGKRVWGSDVDEVFTTDSVLAENGIKIIRGFNRQNITDDVDLVVTSGAHGGLENLEVISAREKGIKTLSLAQEVGDLMPPFKNKISVCGSHGKTTTSAMIAFVFKKLGLAASHLVGAARFSGFYGGHFGGTDYIVVEADEYVSSLGVDNTPRFMYQSPNIIVCTNIDFDHPDVYRDINAIEKAYLDFFKKLDKNQGKLIYNQSDERLSKLVERISLKNKYPFDLNTASHVQLSIPGDHNRQNAAAAISLGKVLRLDTDKVKSALSEFSGVNRRLEKIAYINDVYLYDDYAHHPSEIRAMISAVRELYSHRRLVIIFQPHMATRTIALLDEFARSLSLADFSIVTDIFDSARERKEKFAITSYDIEKKALKMGAKVIYKSKEALRSYLSEIIKKGDVVITVGAGDIYETHSDIINSIKNIN